MKLIVIVVCSLLIEIGSSNTDEVTEQDIDAIMSQDSLTAPICKSSEFSCGKKCIDINLVCDGKKDCPGGEDEYNEFCIIDHKNASCPYPHLQPNRYTVILNYTSRDKQQVPEFTQAVIICKEGYFSNLAKLVTNCIQRSWEPPIMPCRKFCPQINHPELEQTCYRWSQVNCNEIMWEGTLVRFTCQESHLEPTDKEALCLSNGEWSLNPNKIQCRSIRGHITVDTATVLQRKDFPWRVVIREQVNKSVIRYFAGTLIDKKMVLTDGDLFTRSKLPDDFQILVNDDIESWSPPKAYKIRIIHFLPPKYQKFLSPDGLGNLAILESYEEVEYSLTVIPAAISPFSYPASSRMFNNTGIIAILNDSENLEIHDTFITGLKTFEGICKINREKCNQYYGQLLHPDNETLTLFKEINRGSGLIKLHRGLKLYFLEGVYSKQHPNSSDLLIFTFVSDYIEWIDEIRERTKYHNKTTLTKEIRKVVKQLESKSHSTSSYNKLTALPLLMFIILIAVRFRIPDHRFLKITCR